VLGQDLGQLYTGRATDPNTGPLLALMAIALLAEIVDRACRSLSLSASASGVPVTRTDDHSVGSLVPPAGSGGSVTVTSTIRAGPERRITSEPLAMGTLVSRGKTDVN
jgi:hypothetical protein